MNRRRFLKRAGAVLGLSIGITAVRGEPPFGKRDCEKSYGPMPPPPCPEDLQGTSYISRWWFRDQPSPVYVGEEFTAEFTVRNRGTEPGEFTDTAYVRPHDADVYADKTPVEEFTLSVPPKSTATHEFTITAPQTPRWYAFELVDHNASGTDVLMPAGFSFQVVDRL